MRIIFLIIWTLSILIISSSFLFADYSTAEYRAQLPGYFNKLTSDSPIVIYGNEFLKQKKSISAGELKNIFERIIPFIIEQEKDKGEKIFFVAAPADGKTQYQSDSIIFEYKNSKNGITANFDFLENYKVAEYNIAVFAVTILSVEKNKTPKKNSSAKNRMLIQIKIDNQLSIYKVNDLNFAIYFIGRSVKYTPSPQAVNGEITISKNINQTVINSLPTSIQEGEKLFNMTELDKLPAVSPAKIIDVSSIPDNLRGKEEVDCQNLDIPLPLPPDFPLSQKEE